MVRPQERASARIGHERKAVKQEFMFFCEWIGCDFTAESINVLNHHIAAHRRGYTSCLGTDNELKDGEFAFFCSWQDCGAQIVGDLQDFSRHVFYHTFHQYLKHTGQHVINVEQIGPCMLGGQSRNVIPELPEKLQCRWGNCLEIHDNPYLFYSHVSYHTDEMPKGYKHSTKSIQCKWEDCTAKTKTRYKMKEHIRSHTQAKVVACPTCGALFSNNTKFLDHIKRQYPEMAVNYQCTHCNRVFCSERLLRDHSRRHVNHYKCPVCDMTCNHPSGLREHIVYRHSDMRSFLCTKCEYMAKCHKDLFRHLEEQHAKDKEGTIYQCGFDKCPASFDNLKELFLHREEEHDNAPRLFQCHICRKEFTRGTNLTRHLREVHTFSWPSGHRRFRYKLQDDGYRRVETVRYESIEVTEQILGRKLTDEGLKDATSATASLKKDSEVPGENATSAVAAESKSDVNQMYGDSRDSESNSEIGKTDKNDEQILPTDSASQSGRGVVQEGDDSDNYMDDFVVVGKMTIRKEDNDSNRNEWRKKGGKSKGKGVKRRKGTKSEIGEDGVGESNKGIKKDEYCEEVEGSSKVIGPNVNKKKVSFKDDRDDEGDVKPPKSRRKFKGKKRKRETTEDNDDEVGKCDVDVEDEQDYQSASKRQKTNNGTHKKGKGRGGKKGRGVLIPEAKRAALFRTESDGDVTDHEFEEELCKNEAVKKLDFFSSPSSSLLFSSRSGLGPSTSAHSWWNTDIAVESSVLNDDSSNSSTLYTLSHIHDESSLASAARNLDAALLKDGDDDGGGDDNDNDEGVKEDEDGEEVIMKQSAQLLDNDNSNNNNNSYAGEEEWSSMPNFEIQHEVIEEPSSPTRYMLNYSLQQEGDEEEFVKSEGYGGEDVEEEEEVVLTEVEDENEELDEREDENEDLDGEEETEEEEVNLTEFEEEDEEEEIVTETEDGDADGNDDAQGEGEEADEEVEEDDDEEEYENDNADEEKFEINWFFKNEETGWTTEDDDDKERKRPTSGSLLGIKINDDDQVDDVEEELEEIEKRSRQSPTRYTLATPRDESSRSPTLYALPSPIGAPRSPQSPSRYELNSPFGGSENAQSPTRYALNSPEPYDSEYPQSPTLYCLKSPPFTFPPRMASSPTRYTLESVQNQFDENAQSPTQYNLLNSSIESNSRYAIPTSTHPSSNTKSTPNRFNSESFRTIVGSEDPSQSPTLYTLKSPFHSFSYSSQFNLSKAGSPGSVTPADENVNTNVSSVSRNNQSRLSSSIYNSSKGSPSTSSHHHHHHHHHHQQHHHDHLFKSPNSAASPRGYHQSFHSPSPGRVKSPLSFRSAFQQLIQAADGIEGYGTSSPFSPLNLTNENSEDPEIEFRTSTPQPSSSTNRVRQDLRLSNIDKDNRGSFQHADDSRKDGVSENDGLRELSQTQRSVSVFSEGDRILTGSVVERVTIDNIQSNNIQHVTSVCGVDEAAVCDNNNSRNPDSEFQNTLVGGGGDEIRCVVDNLNDQIIHDSQGRIFLQIGNQAIPIEQRINLGVIFPDSNAGDNFVGEVDAIHKTVVVKEESTNKSNDGGGGVKQEVNMSSFFSSNLAHRTRDDAVIIKKEEFLPELSRQNSGEGGDAGANSNSIFLNIRGKVIDVSSSSSNDIKPEIKGAKGSSGHVASSTSGGDSIAKSKEKIETGDGENNDGNNVSKEDGDGSKAAWETYNLEMLGEVALSRNSMDQTL